MYKLNKKYMGILYKLNNPKEILQKLTNEDIIFISESIKNEKTILNKVTRIQAKEIIDLLNTKKIEDTKKALNLLDKLFELPIPTEIIITNIAPVNSNTCRIGCVTSNTIIISPDTVKEKFINIAHLKELLGPDVSHYTEVVLHEFQHIRQNMQKLFTKYTNSSELEKNADDFARDFINLIK